MRNRQNWGDLARENKDKILWTVRKTRMELKKDQILRRYKTAEVHLMENGYVEIIWNGDELGHKTKSICLWTGSTAQTYTLPCDVILWGQIHANLIVAK